MDSTLSLRYLFLFIVLFLDLLCISFAERHLKQVHVLYRHGNRSPMRSYPNDRYNESVWPQGFAMLTQKGMNQQYQLGRWLRQRYVDDLGFLQPTYVAKDVVVHSTATDRTVMSAQSNLAGMFPPSGNQVWNDNLLWQPIGIFTYSTDVDPVLKANMPCPKRTSLIEDKAQPLFDKFLEKNKKMVDFIVKNTGVDRNMHSIGQVKDSLYFQNEENFTLPSWALQKVDGWDGNYFQWIVMLRDYEVAVNYQDASPLLKKLLSGTLVAAMAASFRAVGMNQPSPKFFMYSAHDTNVNGLLSSLDAFNSLVPPPASCVIVELYQDFDSNSLTVDLLYKNMTEKPAYKLRMGPSGKKCKEQCPLETFLEYARKVTPDNFIKDCMMHSHFNSPIEWNTGWLIFAVVFMMFLILAFTMCILTIVTACKGPVYKPRSRLQPIDFHLLGTGLSESEDEAVFDA